MYKNFKPLLLLSCAIMLLSCAHNPYRVTNRAYKKQVNTLAKELKKQPVAWSSDSIQQPPYWVGTVNLGLRKPNYVIIHHTAQNSCAQTLKTFTLTRTQVSAHYVICRDGVIHHMLNDYLRAWHAGAGSWRGNTDINSSSIGIELDNNGAEPFPEPQIKSLLALLNRLKSTYSIPGSNFIGHAEIAPTRKNDPSIFFPWKELAGQGFGKWYSDTTGIAVPDNFQPWQMLRLIGYDTRDTTAALMAFKRHWMQDSTKLMSDADKKVMWLLGKGD